MMNTKTLFASTIALTLIGSTIVPQIAQAEIQTKFFADEGYYFLRVPDTDTTLPATVDACAFMMSTSPRCLKSPMNLVNVPDMGTIEFYPGTTMPTMERLTWVNFAFPVD